MLFGICRGESGEVELKHVGEIKNNTKVRNEPEEEEVKSYSFWRNFRYYLREYCLEGSLHGLKYVGEKRTLAEKCWWIISISISLYFCIILTMATYEKWENSPVMVSFATKETPIWQVPFPVVTLCPETKSLPKLFNYTKYLFMKKDNITLDPETDRKFGYLALICKHMPDFNYSSTSKFTDSSLFDFLSEVQPKFYDEISECRFMNKAYDCRDIWKPILTDEGICYVFNILDRSDLLQEQVVHYKDFHKSPKSDGWTLEHGYPKESGQHTYPQRALFAGASFALEAKFTLYEDEMDFYCGTSLQGYKVQIAHPSRMPTVKEQHFRMPLDQQIIAAVIPDVTTTSDAVKNYNPKRRNCYFPSERNLEYFKVYSQQNCQIECKSHYTRHKCGCVKFYLPRDNSTPICDAGSLNCMRKADHELMFDGIDNKIRALRGEKNIYKNNKWLNCDCLPICTSMYYLVENSQSDWDWRKRYPDVPNSNRTKHMSFLQFFFKGNQFITMERNELFGPTDFLANFGGLLGLCIGFSMLSVMEIIYYLSLRIICNIWMFGKRNWSGH